MASNDNNNMTLASLLVNFVRFLMFFLEAFFISTEPPSETSNGDDSGPSNSDGDDDDEHFKNNGDDQAVLESAFVYFDIDNPEDVTREAVKKKFRRLSLVHHPDRNNQSEESVKEMQKINRYYELLEQEFDRREGKKDSHHHRHHDHHDPDGESDDDSSSAQSDEQDPDEPGISSSERHRRRKRRRNEQKRQQEEYERRRKEMEEEMQREWEETRKKKQEFARQQNKTKLENIQKLREASLHTTHGRDRAHATWKSEIQAFEEQRDDDDDEDDDDDTNVVSGHQERAKSNKKPSNPVMDCCNDDIAIALRLGSTDVAIELIHDSMQSFMAASINYMIHQKMRMHGNTGATFGPTEEDRLELYRSAYSRVLIVPMDEDGNHALFYAVYYEDNEMLSYLTNQARRFDYFAEYITSTNHRGSTVLDFCVGSSNAGFKSRLETLYKEGRETIKEREEAEARENDATLLSQYYFQQLRQHASFEPALFSTFGIVLGRYILCAKWYETVLVLLVTRLISDDSFAKEELYGVMVVNHSWWFVIKGLISFIRNLFPRWLIVGGTLVTGYFFSVTKVMVLAPSVLYILCGVIVDSVLKLFTSIVPPPKNKHLAIALDLTILCTCILLIRCTWGFLPSWRIAETPNAEIIETAAKALSDMTPKERALALFEAVQEEEAASGEEL